MWLDRSVSTAENHCQSLLLVSPLRNHGKPGDVLRVCTGRRALWRTANIESVSWTCPAAIRGRTSVRGSTARRTVLCIQMYHQRPFFTSRYFD